MTQPTVVAVMLTANRPAMAARAVQCFHLQDYPVVHLLIYDTGERLAEGYTTSGITHVIAPNVKQSIGRLRNEAVSMITDLDCVIVHWDDDDWSAPTRISDQVKLLVESGKQVVGYRELLFWKVGEARPHLDLSSANNGEAWLYRNTDPRYCLATSLCYWRATWEAKPFPDAMAGGERVWLKGLDTLGDHPLRYGTWSPTEDDPLMIATIHGQNTVKNQIQTAASNTDGTPMWTRVPAWDARVRSILEAA